MIDYNITLDVRATEPLDTNVAVTQGDTAVRLIMQAVKDGSTLSGISSAKMEFFTSNGYLVEKTASVSGSTITYTLGTQELQSAGKLVAICVITMSDGQVALGHFMLHVRYNPRYDHEVDPGPYIPAVEALIAQIQADRDTGIAMVNQLQAYLQSQDLAALLYSMQGQIDSLVIQAAGTSEPLAAQAKTDAAGHTYTTLKERLDTENAVVKAQISAVNTQISAVNTQISAADAKIDTTAATINGRIDTVEVDITARGDGLHEEIVAIGRLITELHGNYTVDFAVIENDDGVQATAY